MEPLFCSSLSEIGGAYARPTASNVWAGVERLGEGIRRRERVMRIFPSRESAIRLLGAFLMEIDEKWTTGRKYLTMDEYEAWKKPQQASRKSDQACAKAV
ncbi:MAG: DNA polymerase IV [Candidatus Carbobacillus altaicus]|uniref:DNA polymerase IV n=1 Tax=Candidatus Carbonibacillus altaicus TaxID=2163959 RepID=A0A2R6XXA6_9BACL|nr:MAG: DNA polymerase IV [Candidatus Carbobacillus altaicus]